MENNYITVDAANAMLRGLFEEQVNAFGMQQRTIEALNAETRALIDQTRRDVDQSLMTNKQAAEAHANEQIKILRDQTDQAVIHIDGKLDEMRSMLLQHDKTQAEAGAENKKLVETLEKFASEVKESIPKTQTEVNHTQSAITQLIDTTRADGTSTVLRSGSGGERDRSVFDPRDYKIEFLPSQFA